ADRDRRENELVDPDEQRPPGRNQHDERQQDHRREQHARSDSDEPAGHAASASVAARSAWRLSMASIASAFIAASISCGLKRARSNNVVSREAASRPPVSSPSTLPRYSCGASNRRRGTP